MNTMIKRIKTGLQAAAALALLTSCASGPADRVTDRDFAAMMAGSFRAEGIAGMDRVQQDEGQKACSTGEAVPAAQAEAMQNAALAQLKPPADGRYLGDWKAGEALAQNGRGMTWTDKSAMPSANGGSCYNCHQISKQEIAFGTIGPSLYQYGKLRGVTDPSSPAAKPIVEYTWNKIHDAWAYSACSNMPRFGHRGLLSDDQIRDLMALLLDPKSPVNAD